MQIFANKKSSEKLISMWWKQFKTLKIQFSPPFCSQEKIKSSVEIFCIFRFFIAKINDKLIVTAFYYFLSIEKALLLYFPSQIDFLIEYYLLHQHCQLFHNHLLISRGSARVIIAPRKHLIPLCDQNTPTRNCRQRSLSSTIASHHLSAKD